MHLAVAAVVAIVHLAAVVMVVGLIHQHSTLQLVKLILQLIIQHITYTRTVVVLHLVHLPVAAVAVGMVAAVAVQAAVYNLRVQVVDRVMVIQFMRLVVKLIHLFFHIMTHIGVARPADRVVDKVVLVQQVDMEVLDLLEAPVQLVLQEVREVQEELDRLDQAARRYRLAQPEQRVHRDLQLLARAISSTLTLVQETDR